MNGIRRSIRVVLVGIAIFVGFSGTALWSGTAHAAQQGTGEAENTLTTDINHERTSRGLGALTVAGDLVAYAEHHSADMAAAGHPYHDPDIQANVQNWQHLGDNVGSGPDAEHLHQGFMNSQIHRDEILMPDYTQVGVGAYWAGNVLYVTEVFRLPEQAAAPVVRTVATPAPRPAAAPRAAVHSVAAAAAAPVTTPPTTAPAPPTSTSTSLVAAATPQWPPASTVLDARSAASHGAKHADLSGAAVAAAVLLMLVAGLEAHNLRRRAERS